MTTSTPTEDTTMAKRKHWRQHPPDTLAHYLLHDYPLATTPPFGDVPWQVFHDAIELVRGADHLPVPGSALVAALDYYQLHEVNRVNGVKPQDVAIALCVSRSRVSVYRDQAIELVRAIVMKVRADG